MDQQPPDSPSAATSSEGGAGADATLGGYFATHERPPAFEGSDGHPYTVSVEVERTANLRAPYAGYLVFPRWAQSGVGIVGHVETPTLVEAESEAEAIGALGQRPLLAVQQLLEAAIARSREADVEGAESR